MNRTLLLAGVAACFLASNANAFDYQQYVSGKLTYSNASHDVKVSDSNEGSTNKAKFNDNILGGSLAYGIKSGAIRSELELNIKQDAEKNFSDEDGAAKFSMENNSVMLNGYYDINTGTKLTPYIGAGIGMARLKAQFEHLQNGKSVKSSKSKTNFAWQVGAGVSYAVTDNLALDMGYRYTNADKVNVKEGNNLDLEYEAKSHEFLLGARYAF